MNQDLHMRTAACSEYQRLLRICQGALVAWKERREEIVRLGLEGKTTGDELRRLQAEYARSYNRLERHPDSCEVCRFTPRYAYATANHREFPA